MLLSPLLQEYLIENGSLPLPAAGRLTIQHAPAQLNEADTTFIAPTSKIVFSDKAPAESEIEKLAAFISRQLNISNEQANDLLKKELVSASLTDGSDNDIQLPDWNLWDKTDTSHSDPQQPLLNNYLPAFPVEKIFRQPVTVSETIKLPTEIISEIPALSTKVVIEELYPDMDEPTPKDYWWVWALVIFVVSVMLIANRFA